MARVGDAGDQLNAVQVQEGDAPRPCTNGREWTSKTVVESAAPRALAANPFAVAFHRDVYLFEGVTGTEELYEALRKDGFQSLFVAQSEARDEAFEPREISMWRDPKVRLVL